MCSLRRLKIANLRKLRSKGATRQRSKLRTIMLVPIKVLIKAADFYAKCLEDCNGKIGYNGFAVFSPVAPSTSTTISSSFSASSYNYKRRCGDYEEEEVKNLLRAVSKRRTIDELDSDMQIRKQMEVVQAAGPSSDDMKGYSVGIGKLGRIVEDEPCSFNEADHLLYKMSRSCAAKRSFMFY